MWQQTVKPKELKAISFYFETGKKGNIFSFMIRLLKFVSTGNENRNLVTDLVAKFNRKFFLKKRWNLRQVYILNNFMVQNVISRSRKNLLLSS